MVKPHAPSTGGLGFSGLGARILGLLVDPTHRLPYELRHPSLALLALVFGVGQLSCSTAIFLTCGFSGNLLHLVVDVLISMGVQLVTILTMGALMALFLSMLGGAGDGARLLWALVLGDAPWILATPLIVLAMGARLVAAPLEVLLVFLAFLALTLASFLLKARAMALVFHVETPAAAFAYLACYGAILMGGVWFGMTSWIWSLNRIVALSG